jgi:hypothetical protein
VSAVTKLPSPQTEICSVSGRLLDSIGAPVARAADQKTVVFEDWQGRKRRARFAGSESYRIEGLEPGAYSISAWARGYASARVAFMVTAGAQILDIPLLEAPSLRLEVHDHDGRTLGAMLASIGAADAEMILSSMSVAVREAADQSAAPSTRFVRSRDRGDSPLLGWLDGNVESRSTLVLTIGSREIASAFVPPAAETIDFRVAGLTNILVRVSAVVEDAAGGRVTDGALIVEVADVTRILRVTSNDLVLYVPPGALQASYSGTASTAPTREYAIPTDVDELAITIQACASSSLRGRLIGGLGESLEETTVFLFADDGSGSLRQVGFPTLAEASGAFSFRVAAGDYYIQVRPTPGAPYVVSDLVPATFDGGSEQKTPVVVAPPAVLRVRNANPTSAIGYSLSLRGLVLINGLLAPMESHDHALWPTLYALEERRGGAPGTTHAVQLDDWSGPKTIELGSN